MLVLGLPLPLTIFRLDAYWQSIIEDAVAITISDTEMDNKLRKFRTYINLFSPPKSYKSDSKQVTYTTPKQICEMMCKERYRGEGVNREEINLTNSSTLDLFAGNGALATLAEAKQGHVLAVERDLSRVEAGLKMTERTGWINEDVFSEDFLKLVLSNKFKVDYVIANPPFNLAFQAIHVALRCLKPGGKLIFLLPSDYFYGSRMNFSAYLKADFYVDYDIFLGRVNYLPDTNKKRLFNDSIYVIRPLEKGANPSIKNGRRRYYASDFLLE